MTKVLVLYYSSYGHIETMAYAVADGVREAGAEAVVKRVPETVPAEIAKANHFKLDQPAPVATPQELAEYDAVIVGVPTRFGRMASQMAAFWDGAGALFVHVPNGWLFTAANGGWEYPAFLVVAAVSHVLTGEGAFALKPTVLPAAAVSAFRAA